MSATRDRSLMVRSIVPTSDTVPMSTYYQREDAQSASASRVTWYITSPGHNMLLDPHALVEYTVTIKYNGENPVDTLRLIFGNNSAAETLTTGPPLLPRGVNAGLNPQKHFALRQNFPFIRCIQSASVTINGQTMSTQPESYIDQLNRLYLSQQESETYASTSAGFYDDGCHYPQMTGRGDVTVPVYYGNGANTGGEFLPLARQSLIPPNPNPETQTWSYFGKQNRSLIVNNTLVRKWDSGQACRGNPAYVNSGYTARFNRIEQLCRATNSLDHIGGDTATARYPQSLTFTIVEPIPLAPFFMYPARDSKMSIPWVEQMQLTYLYNSNWKQMLLQGGTQCPFGLADAAGLDITFTNPKPRLLLRWFVPPRAITTSIPPQISMPVWQNRQFQMTYQQPIVLADAAYNTQDAQSEIGAVLHKQFNNLRLEQWPDLMLVYLKIDPGTTTYKDASDGNFHIYGLSISVDGLAGRILDASSRQLYEMWRTNTRHNGKKSCYEAWRRHHCVAAIRPRDLGLLQGPGIDHPVTLHLNVDYEIMNQVGQTGDSEAYDKSWNPYDTVRTVTMYVQCIYNRYIFTISEDGKSKLEMLKLPSKSLSAPINESTASFANVAL